MGTKVVVIGGGITGQLVQHAIPCAQVFDWGKEPDRRLTRSWGANYLWEPIAGLPYREFEVITHINGAPATSESVRRYKMKIGKGDEVGSPKQMERLLKSQFPIRMTGYDFTSVIPATVVYGKRAIQIDVKNRWVAWADGSSSPYDVLVNTTPLYSFLTLLTGFTEREQENFPSQDSFQFAPIYVKVMSRLPDSLFPPEVVYVNYLSEGDGPYRFCDRNGERHYEGLTNMGTIPNKKLVPGKIKNLGPVDEAGLMYQLYHWGIATIGRYGAWRSDELVHETYRGIVALKELHRL